MDELDLMVDGGDPLDLNGTGFDTEDWIIDCNSQFALLNYLTYDVSVASNIDGLYDGLVTIPEMGSEKAGSILWVLLTSGIFHTVRVKADSTTVVGENNEPLGQTFHLRYVESTMYYQGQQS